MLVTNKQQTKTAIKVVEVAISYKQLIIINK